jgi:hypothetical protein
MLPNPAAMAVPPRTASPASWNPAEPPPPAAGAPLGTALDWARGDAAPLVAPVAGALLAPVAGALLEEPAAGLPLPAPPGPELLLSAGCAEVPALAPLLGVLVAEELAPLAPGALGDSVVTDGEPPVQAESATQASTVVRPQPTAVSQTRWGVHAMAVRALIEPPCVLSAMTISRSPARETEESGGDLKQ